MTLFAPCPVKAYSSHRNRPGLLLACIAAAALSAGCSNFDSRQRYWDQQLAGKLKAAIARQVEQFANANGHEVHCSAYRIESDPGAAECYIVDARSKGALINYRGKLFVMMKMVNGKLASHTFSTSTVLY